MKNYAIITYANKAYAPEVVEVTSRTLEEYENKIAKYMDNMRKHCKTHEDCGEVTLACTQARMTYI